MKVFPLTTFQHWYGNAAEIQHCNNRITANIKQS